jgi:hypothetical protein
MVSLRSSVYSFDCTDYRRKEFNTFTFNQWCIGNEQNNMQLTSYIKTKKPIDDYVFYSLTKIKKKLNHKKIDLLKMDIEGFEWNIIQTEIINNNNTDDLPVQLLFELHTDGANPECVG